MNFWDRVKNKKIVIGFLIFDAVLISILAIVNILGSIRSAAVNISVAPVDAVITINGKKYDNNSSYKLFPKNNATIEISHDGLETQKITVDFKRNSTTSIHRYLSNKKDKFSYYLQDENQKDLDQLDKIAPFLSGDDELQVFVKKMGIRNALPISYEECTDEANKYSCFSLFINAGYYKDCGRQFCIAISDNSSEKHEDTYSRLVTEKGFKLSDYKVIYENKSIRYIEENP